MVTAHLELIKHLLIENQGGKKKKKKKTKEHRLLTEILWFLGKGKSGGSNSQVRVGRPYCVWERVLEVRGSLT